MISKKVKDTVIELFQGDICSLNVDAITNAANNHWIMGGGVAGSIKRKGGDVVEEEARAQGPKPVGSAIITTAGELKAKYVIHAAVMGLDLRTDEEKIKTATKNTLKLADENKVKSIALPAFGTGVGGFPIDSAAKIMIDTITEYINNGTNLNKIIIALFDKPAFQIFENTLQ